MTMKITFTHISMKNGKIGVLGPGSRIRDEPKYYPTEDEAIRAVCSHPGNKGKHKVHIQFCDTVYNKQHTKASFVPQDFMNACNERMKKHKPRQTVTE